MVFERISPQSTKLILTFIADFQPLYELIERKEPNRYQVKANRKANQLYVKNQTYHYPWVKQEGTLLRSCHFDFTGKLKLTDQELSVFEGNKWHHFPIHHLNNIEIAHKHFILPLILGGTIAPLSLLAALSGYFMFWVTMALGITGLMLFYYGFQGGHQVSVNQDTGMSFRFFVDERNLHLNQFIGFINFYLRDPVKAFKVYADELGESLHNRKEVINYADSKENATQEDMKYLIVGLGNIGPEYAKTRHNIGFMVLDELAKLKGASFDSDRLAFKTEIKHRGRTLHLIKPTTFMNLSGKSLRHWMNTLKIPVENVLVIVDDLAIPFGSLRMRGKGSAAGHNGLKNIEQLIGHNKYPRLRFGIGDDFSKGKQIDFVLNKFTADEQIDLSTLIDKSCEMVLSFAAVGLNQTMNQHNS